MQPKTGKRRTSREHMLPKNKGNPTGWKIERSRQEMQREKSAQALYFHSKKSEFYLDGNEAIKQQCHDQGCVKERALQREGLRDPARQRLRGTIKYGTIQTRNGEGLHEGTCDNEYWGHQGGLGCPLTLHMPLGGQPQMLTLIELRTQGPVLDHI